MPINNIYIYCLYILCINFIKINVCYPIRKNPNLHISDFSNFEKTRLNKFENDFKNERIKKPVFIIFENAEILNEVTDPCATSTTLHMEIINISTTEKETSTLSSGTICIDLFGSETLQHEEATKTALNNTESNTFADINITNEKNNGLQECSSSTVEGAPESEGKFMMTSTKTTEPGLEIMTSTQNYQSINVDTVDSKETSTINLNESKNLNSQDNSLQELIQKLHFKIDLDKNEVSTVIIEIKT
uniref:Uncharacterized protein n=1 Tax=Clastoptera arizonana TaxID=38151 RepID=A0A1B6E144_9HEMI